MKNEKEDLRVARLDMRGHRGWVTGGVNKKDRGRHPNAEW